MIHRRTRLRSLTALSLASAATLATVPAKLNYGSGGNGSAGHLAGEMFNA